MDFQEAVDIILKLPPQLMVLEKELQMANAEIKRINLINEQLKAKLDQEALYKNKYEAVKEQLAAKDKQIARLEQTNGHLTALNSAQWVMSNSMQALEAAARILEEERASKRARAD